MLSTIRQIQVNGKGTLLNILERQDKYIDHIKWHKSDINKVQWEQKELRMSEKV